MVNSRSKIYLLMTASVVLFFFFLGAKEIWTQEHRWADIVSGMFYRHDFWHPYLLKNDYYDKPLLSYWLIAGFVKLFGKLSVWALRLPSALAGLLAVFSIYKLGTRLKNQQLGLLAGWMLLTTFYVVFWARVSSADMLNMAGSLFAVAWYAEKREKASFFDFMIFFLILAVTSLCKGLVGAVVAVIAIVPDLFMHQRWKRYLKWSLVLSVLPAVCVYLFPFWASQHWGGNYGENGLYLVYRENVLRYFQPFDHKDPIITYFIYLPIYLLPWTLFFIPALFRNFKKLSDSSRWIGWSTFLLFLFFTLSGSRRSYYILPVVPFAILWTADWITEKPALLSKMKYFIGCAFGVLSLNFIVVQPLYYAGGGLPAFSSQLSPILATQVYSLVLLDAESKLNFYLGLPPTTSVLDIQGPRDSQTVEHLLTIWPILKSPPSNTIFISRAEYKPLLVKILQPYRLIETPRTWGEQVMGVVNKDAPIAFIPKKIIPE